MANAAAKLFTSFIETEGLRFEVCNPDEEGNVVHLGYSLDNTHVDIYVDFGADNEDVHFYATNFVKIPEEKRGISCQICNTLNNTYRFVKFTWDEEDASLDCKADAVIQLDSCAEEAFELVVRITQIIDDAYPTIMKALWA